MILRRPLVFLFVLVATLLISGAAYAAGRNPAPQLTPVPTVTTPVPTTTVVPPTATPTSTPPPTALSVSTPSATPTIAGPTASPTAVPVTTPTPSHRRRHHHHHHRRKAHHGATSGTTSSSSAPSPDPGSVQLPTVGDLQAEGRLGNGSMPADVRRWAYLIIPAATANGIPADMIAAVMTAESGGDPLAWNTGSNARGLMQILGGPWDPSANIDVGASMLAGLKQEFGSWKLALAAYNAGPGAVTEYGGVPPYQETEDYVVIVQFYYGEYSNQPLNGSARVAFSRSLHRFHKLRPRIRFLKLQKGQHRGENPGINVLPDGCDSSGLCRPRNLPHPITDPFWPLGGSKDPLPVVHPEK